MEMRAYLRACQLEAERKEAERRKKLDAILTPVGILAFWAVLIGAWLFR